MQQSALKPQIYDRVVQRCVTEQEFPGYNVVSVLLFHCHCHGLPCIPTIYHYLSLCVLTITGRFVFSLAITIILAI